MKNIIDIKEMLRLAKLIGATGAEITEIYEYNGKPAGIKYKFYIPKKKK